MPGFLSQIETTSNAIELARAARQERGLPLFDFTNTNPTTLGLLYPPEILERCFHQYAQKRAYRPDSKGLRSAREAISSYYQQRRLKVDPEHIIITSGTSEAYSLLFAVLADPGDNILTPLPSYPLIELLLERERIEPHPYLLSEDRDWEIESQSLAQAKDAKTRAIVVVSPHNPTGATAERHLASISSLELPLIADEVFAEFTASGESAPPLGTLYPDRPVFHLNGISKMLGLPDCKLSWIAMNEQAASKWCERLSIANDLYLSAATWIQEALPALLLDGEPFVHQMRERVRNNIDASLEVLAGFDHIKTVRPRGGYFLFPRFSTLLDDENFCRRLIEQGIFAHPGFFFGVEQGTYLALSMLLKDGLPDQIAHLAEATYAIR